MKKFSTGFQRLLVAAPILAALVVSSYRAPASAADSIAARVATAAGNKFVAKIGPETCAQFAATMKEMKSNGASPSPMSAKLKANSDARTAFVNVVAAPLLNKLIDCNMLPGGS